MDSDRSLRPSAVALDLATIASASPVRVFFYGTKNAECICLAKYGIEIHIQIE